MGTITTAFDFVSNNWEAIALIVTTVGTLIPTDHDGNSVAGRIKNLLGAVVSVGGTIFGKKVS